MGKDSKHQRTKGGAQPSSASRTAELLEKSGQPISFLAAAAEARQEFAFSSSLAQVGSSGSPVHGILANVLIDEQLPAEVKLVFRKLQKKDATTKIKALGELTQVFESNGEDLPEREDGKPDQLELSRVLPQWSKNFPKLTVDDSRKVRELTESTHAVICKAVGRNLAPYLKQIVPHWYLAQFDIYGPVASAAQSSFRTVFPSEKKQAEVVKFCVSEVMAHVSGNLDVVFPRVKKEQEKGKKKKKVQGEGEEEEEVKGEERKGVDGDSENYEIRTAYASVMCVGSLVAGGLVSDEFVEFLFGGDGVFWRGAEFQNILIRRSCFDLLSTFVSVSESDRLNCIPADKCARLINQALSVTQKEILPSVWNCFLTLTLKGVLKELGLARKQLLNCCKNGFYGNASQIGAGVLPMLARIWEGMEEEEARGYAESVVKGFTVGYEAERSNYEKAAILRTFAEVVGFFVKNGIEEQDELYGFVCKNLKSVSGGEFPRLLGALVKEAKFYERLIARAGEEGVVGSKEFGEFVVGVVTCPSSLFADEKPVRRGPRVKFEEPAVTEVVAFEQLQEHKQNFLCAFVRNCVEKSHWDSLAVVSRRFGSLGLWKDVEVNGIEIGEDVEKRVAVNLTLDLIKLHPESPRLLGQLSDLFERFAEPSELVVFLKELSKFVRLKPIGRWVRMERFSTVIEDCVRGSELSESELGIILKFVFGEELQVERVCSLLVGRMDPLEDRVFFEHLARIMGCSSFTVDVGVLYARFWEIYLSSVVDGEEGWVVELAESVCVRNADKLSSTVLVGSLEEQLGRCTVKQLHAVVGVCRKMGIGAEDLEELWELPALTVKPELLAFVGLGFTVLHDALEEVKWFGGVEKSVVVKAVCRGLFVGESEVEECVDPLVAVLYAQAVARVGARLEECGFQASSDKDELVKELEVISSRLVERVYSEKRVWKELEKEMGRSRSDTVWESGLPVRVLREYCDKSEISYGIAVGLAVEGGFEEELNHVLACFAVGEYRVGRTINWIMEKRNGQAEAFEFDVLFRHAKNRGFLNKLLVVVVELLERVSPDNEEFLSAATCWIEAWLKNSKNPELGSKTQLLWVSNLARAVKCIGERAREGSCPNFPQEYVEFHCAQMYPVVYSLFLQLNEVEDMGFWTTRAVYYLSGAICGMPAITLAFVEPDSVKICDTFAAILEKRGSWPAKIAAYRVLRKVKYESGAEEKQLPIIPPGVDRAIRGLMGSGGVGELGGGSEEDMDKLVCYLLVWDALLKIQESSNEFASYVRDQEHLLTPFLNTIFFCESIPLENATSKCFDTDPEVIPGSKISVLHLSCAVLQRVLRNLPYTVRWWWNTHVQKQRDRVFVEKCVVKHLSSKLAAEELGSVKLRQGIDDNVTVHCHSGCNELVAHYRIEETNVTLTISLPLNHPLGPVTVRISNKKLHAKISHLLNTRSHSLSAGLRLWKENLDGLYKDVDECAICFFILHHVTKQTPKLACKTCRKKFHAACLYKWFSTSNKSECPLCRNLF